MLMTAFVDIVHEVCMHEVLQHENDEDPAPVVGTAAVFGAGVQQWVA